MSAVARGALVFLLVLLSGACTRPLTDAETAMAQDIFGDRIQLERVRIGKEVGLSPLPNRALAKVDVRRPGENPCERVPTPPRAEAPPAFALGNFMFFSGKFYAVDGGFLWPYAVRLPHTLIFAHELVHVWQWQNRAVTGYTPFAALAEGFEADAYFYNRDDAPELFAFGFEQQASIVEDYLCHVILDPSNPALDELRELVAPIVDTERFEARINAVRR